MNIIFDLDGTLFQTQPCIINAVNKFFSNNGLEPIEVDSILQNIGKRSNDFLSSILPPNINVKDVYEEFSMYEKEEISKNGQLFDGIVALLDYLKTNEHHLYLCSNGSDEYINLVLEKSKIKQYFEKIISTKFISKKDTVKELINKNDLFIMIGDTIYDIDAAIENNIPVIGVSYGYGDKENITKATYVANTVNDIEYYIRQIDLFFLISKKINISQKKVIAINGVDTSGKSIFTNQFAKFLISTGRKTEVLHIDDFHNPLRVRMTGINEIEAYYKNAFNYDQVISEVLEPLQQKETVNKNVVCLNLDTDKYENEISYNIDNETTLLVEGVLLFRTPLIEYFDAKIFIHITFEEVLKRAKLRDVPKYGEAFLDKYINKYIPIQKKYMKEHQPLKNSDIIINNQDYSFPFICEESELISV